MVTRVQKWGNSQGLRVPKEVLAQARIGLGDAVRVSARPGRIIIEPVAKVRGQYQLKDLVARIPKTYPVEEVDWGPSEGKEVW